jgi:hypothetical protein
MNVFAGRIRPDLWKALTGQVKPVGLAKDALSATLGASCFPSTLSLRYANATSHYGSFAEGTTDMDQYRFRHIRMDTGEVLETDLIEGPEELWDQSPESADESWCVYRDRGVVRAIRISGITEVTAKPTR